MVLFVGGLLTIVATTLASAFGFDVPGSRAEFAVAGGLAATALATWFAGVFDRAR
jgi:hypothetical protein